MELLQLSVVLMILQESIFITTLSGIFGLLFGIFMLSRLDNQLEKYFILNPYVDTQTSLIATLLLIFFGAIAGYIPATRASRIKPIIAIER